MRIAALAVLSMFTLTAVAKTAAPADPYPQIDIPYEKHILPNGLTLIIHEDHKAPIVAVNVWYHVGSKDEPEGLHGFAHLFEHLMFNGSEHYNDDYFRPLAEAGATKLNGTTWMDRTNYFQNVPTSALDRTLWMESDRMGHLVGAIDQARLDEQRGVVLNEKRQGENEPYGKVDELIARESYPVGHPYSWTTIGSEKDLNAATVPDVKNWFTAHYGAANATLVIAGDVQPAEVLKKVQLYFGDIAPGPVLSRQGPWPAKMKEDKRAFIQDRVPQARVFRVWNIPGSCDSDNNVHGIAAGVLADGKNSRLYKRLVYTDQIATDVSIGMEPFEIGTQFTVDAMVKPGGDVKAVEDAIAEEIGKFLREGPTAEELNRLKTKYFAEWTRGLERLDGFGGKSSYLAHYQVYCGSPDAYKTEIERVRKAGAQDVRAVARDWLSAGSLTVEVQPFPEYQVAKEGADRSKVPDLGTPPDLRLPTLARATLSNGLKVVLAERHNVPVVQLNLLVDAGYAADSGPRPGTAKLALDMLDEGTAKRNALGISARAEELGAIIGTGSDLDTSFISLNALKSRLNDSLELFSDVLLHPTFPDAELKRLQKLTLAAIQQEKAEPAGIASRIYPELIYGSGHAYAHPLSGMGTEASVQAISVEDLRAFYKTWLRPDNATLLIVGDTTLAEIKPLLETALASWKAPATPLPTKNLATVALPDKSRVFLVNRTGAEQSLILAAEVAPPKSDPDDIPMLLANAAFGGTFLGRINMNLREDKHWSYGSFTRLPPSRGQRPFQVDAPVQSDKTIEAIQQIQREYAELLGNRPLKAEEIKLAKDQLVRRLPGNNETAGEIAGSYTTVLVYGLADSYWNDYVSKVGALSDAEINAAAKKLVHPGNLTWVIVGDLAKIEDGVRALKLGEVKVLDADGRVLR
jgi:zinc protease